MKPIIAILHGHGASLVFMIHFSACTCMFVDVSDGALYVLNYFKRLVNRNRILTNELAWEFQISW